MTYAGVYYGAGIAVASGSPSIDHVTFLNNANYGLSVWGGTPTLDNVTVTGATVNGINITGAATTVIVTNSSFANSAGYGVNVGAGGGVSLSGTSISECGSYAVGAEAGTRILSATGMPVSANGGGTKNSIGYRGGTVAAAEAWHFFAMPGGGGTIPAQVDGQRAGQCLVSAVGRTGLESQRGPVLEPR